MTRETSIRRAVKSFIVAGLALLTTAGAGDALVQDVQVSTTAASGEYLQLTTRQVFDYNAITGVITPTGRQGDLQVFAHIIGTTCALDCVEFTVHVAITGVHDVSWQVIATDEGGYTSSPDNVGPYSGPSPVVTAVNGFSVHEYQGKNGVAVATLFIDGNAVGNASASY